jgi:CspA family cold shock protein
MLNGRVRWFDDKNGFGFITPDDGSEDLLVQLSTVNMSGLKFLKERQKVSFEVMHGPDGGQASNINLQYQKPLIDCCADQNN